MMSAIQLTHAGPPTAWPACMKNTRTRKMIVVAPTQLSPPAFTIHTGTVAIANQRNRWMNSEMRKINFRLPVRSINTLAGMLISDAINGMAVSRPN